MKALVIVFFSFLPFCLWAQPRQTDYFHKEYGTNWRKLDPGDHILANSVLIGNHHLTSTVSFSLSWDDSFDKNATSVYSLEPMFASTFGMSEQKGCYIKIVTSFGKDDVAEITYFLEKGNCFMFQRQ